MMPVVEPAQPPVSTMGISFCEHEFGAGGGEARRALKAPCQPGYSGDSVARHQAFVGMGLCCLLRTAMNVGHAARRENRS
jgi:hypothetical protein